MLGIKEDSHTGHTGVSNAAHERSHKCWEYRQF